MASPAVLAASRRGDVRGRRLNERGRDRPSRSARGLTGPRLRDCPKLAGTRPAARGPRSPAHRSPRAPTASTSERSSPNTGDHGGASLANALPGAQRARRDSRRLRLVTRSLPAPRLGGTRHAWPIAAAHEREPTGLDAAAEIWRLFSVTARADDHPPPDRGVRTPSRTRLATRELGELTEREREVLHLGRRRTLHTEIAEHLIGSEGQRQDPRRPDPLQARPPATASKPSCSPTNADAFARRTPAASPITGLNTDLAHRNRRAAGDRRDSADLPAQTCACRRRRSCFGSESKRADGSAADACHWGRAPGAPIDPARAPASPWRSRRRRRPVRRACCSSAARARLIVVPRSLSRPKQKRSRCTCVPDRSGVALRSRPLAGSSSSPR